MRTFVVLALFGLIAVSLAADATQSAEPTQAAAESADGKEEHPAEVEASSEEKKGEKKEGEEEAPADDGHPEGRCEICVFALTRKIRDESNICHSLGGIYHKTCKEVLEAMVRWDQNVVHWLYQRGCEHVKGDGKAKLVRPCPPHAVCAWITHNEKSFCEEDRFYHQ